MGRRKTTNCPGRAAGSGSPSVDSKLRLRVGPEIDVDEILLRKRGQGGNDFVHAIEGKAEGATGEMRIAAAFLERRGFECDPRPMLMGGDRGAQGIMAKECGIAHVTTYSAFNKFIVDVCSFTSKKIAQKPCKITRQSLRIVAEIRTTGKLLFTER
jgi:hypothetical protein